MAFRKQPYNFQSGSSLCWDFACFREHAGPEAWGIPGQFLMDEEAEDSQTSDPIEVDYVKGAYFCEFFKASPYL